MKSIADALGKSNERIGGEGRFGPRRHFTKIFRSDIENKNFTDAEFRVYIFLKSFCISNNFCWPGQPLIAESLGKSVDTIKRIIKSLNDKGLIQIKKEGRHNKYCPLK